MPRIHEELKQSKPFSDAGREFAVTVLRTSDVLRHALERALEPWAISPEQYNVLRILKGAGKEGHPTLAIAERMISRSPNVTRLIDKLIAKGLVRRGEHASDRRVALVVITRDGTRVLGEMDTAVDAVMERVGGISIARLRAAATVMDHVRERIEVQTARESLRTRGVTGRAERANS